MAARCVRRASPWAPGIDRFFIPSSRTYTTLQPWGSDPMIDGLLSTDQTQMIYDGAFYSRFDKLRLMKDWAPLGSFVRVCYEKPDAFRNCGECAKCRRTMMMLASLGVLESFPAFPKVRTPSHFFSCCWETPHLRECARQIIAQSEESGAKGLAWTGRITLLRSNAKRHAKNVRDRTRTFRHPFSSIARRDRTVGDHNLGRR